MVTVSLFLLSFYCRCHLFEVTSFSHLISANTFTLIDLTLKFEHYNIRDVEETPPRRSVTMPLFPNYFGRKVFAVFLDHHRAFYALVWVSAYHLLWYGYRKRGIKNIELIFEGSNVNDSLLIT